MVSDMLIQIVGLVALFAHVCHGQYITSCSKTDIACLSNNAQYTITGVVTSVTNASTSGIYSASVQVLCSYYSNINSPPITAGTINVTNVGRQTGGCKPDLQVNSTSLVLWLYISNSVGPVYSLQAPCVGSVELTNTTLKPLSDLVYQRAATDQVKGTSCTLLSPPPYGTPSPTPVTQQPTGNGGLMFNSNAAVLSVNCIILMSLLMVTLAAFL
ncbi:hypothetical protein SmJEL517_g04303 [Synchytrium microbalum]|uniref:Uncharacterized protein n=1 Tax=Synchytrium microbalum TaxID=1806994 RepID=A0A507C3P8_9FUNG|nr:uncharacterized protein SmJEL517_g04303 [Synchytrium microbalum]TPX32586.1 hypothetical protein SmJEL517_g04303 [Synchytrium microbalum]